MASLVLPLFSVFLSITAQAQCRVHVPVKDFLHESGYSIYFDFAAIFDRKGYQEVEDASLADHVLLLEGMEIEGRFHRAQARFLFGDLEVFTRRVCLTQYCGISDYAVAFRKAYRSLDKKIPPCSKAGH